MPGVSTTKSLYLKTTDCYRDFLLLHQMLSYIPLLFSSQVSEEHFIFFHVLLKAIFRLFFFFPDEEEIFPENVQDSSFT